MITDPQAIKFVNEVVRPLCERVRALNVDINAARAAYDAGIGDFFFTHGAEAIADNRDTEGISRLTGNDVLAFVSVILDSVKITLNNNATTIAKPCVRTLIT